MDCLFNICLSVSFVCLFLLLLCLLFVFISFYKVCKDTKQRTSPFSEVLVRSGLSTLSSTWLTISGYLLPIVLRTILDKINTNTTNMSKSSFSHLFIPLSLSSVLIGTQAIHTEHNFSQLTGERTEAYRMWYTDRVSIIHSEISLDF